MLCLSAGKYLPTFGGMHDLHLGDRPVQEACWVLQTETVIILYCSPADRVTLLQTWVSVKTPLWESQFSEYYNSFKEMGVTIWIGLI